MVRAFVGAVTASIMVLAGLESAPAASDTVEAITVASLAGSWDGQAKLIPASGPAEFYKCTMTYAPNGDGSEIKQSLLCKSPQFTKFDALTELSIAGEKVTGKWQDSVSSLNGTVRGTTKDGGFDLVLDSSYFQATMLVVSTGCEQSIKLVPSDTSDMKEMAVTLRRC
jgi:hypothetical protein